MKLKLNLIMAGLICAGHVQADAIIGDSLSKHMLTPKPTYDVIVSFDEHADIDSVLRPLAVPYLGLQTLPMAGATLTRVQIEQLKENPAVVSVYANSPLEYYNYESGEITGGHYVQDQYGVTGEGSVIAVLDSGVDGTHPDLTFGDTVIENVKIVGDLDLTGGNTTFIEGVPNSDTSSGHGTHVAGTVAGSGAASANDERRAFYHDGIAPGAKLVGLGAGEGLNILFGLQGFDYAITNQERLEIDIITNSWGGGDGMEFDPNNPINQASFEAYKRGMVVSFAASNSGPEEDTLNQYAIAPWVINVAAGTKDKELADFSSRGVADHPEKLPDITAPGAAITSTRAVNTAIGAMGPVVDPAHPDYYLYYHTISGTSMATPFVAGTAALMLSVNPDLSPDQIESIIKETADPMSYLPHEVGAGYINVLAAIDKANETQGERAQFLAGDTQWASQGEWTMVDDNDPRLTYVGDWEHGRSSQASGGEYREVDDDEGTILASVRGDRIRLHFLVTDDDDSDVRVVSNGKTIGSARVQSANASEENPQQVTVAFTGLGDELVNQVEIHAGDEDILFDAMEIDGDLMESDVTYTEVTTTEEGTMGPSAENLEVQEFVFETTEADINVDAELSWTGVADLDFYLLNAAGETVASSASLGNPEKLSYWLEQPGTYTLQVSGYISAVTPFTVTRTITTASK
ncbi:S8 family peptidase [Alteromonas ponticola]|uniref:S8 family serine peptidase n=1 Tax=Alteromonas ponticola TaxID=2720613 RepID=A0ABX1R2I9_9ALTE|nr:S8 family serine peptidase [Alteromonas ponticola]NMH60693.1 S8 family serine peptidase [Alteromonas ponticola]